MSSLEHHDKRQTHNSSPAQNINLPYPGLRPYREEEEDNFFGREADCKILIDKILVHRLTLLFAATGVGKSSLLQAAVIPELKAPHGENLDVVYYNDWISEPLKSLKHTIRTALQTSGTWREAVTYTPSEEETLKDFLRFCTLFTRQPLVIVLDQFEEFFRYQKGRPVFEPFLAQLTSIFSDSSLHVHLVLSMREDFALELDAFKQYAPLSVFENLYRLDKLRRKQAKEAILLPLEPTGFQYEPALLEQLLEDLLSRDLRRDGHSPLADLTESVEPPYLQIVCSRLWALEENNPDRILRLKTYQKAGGATGLLGNYIQKVLKSFSAHDKVLASRAFDHLISRHGAKMPYTPEDLASAIRAEQEELEAVLIKLSDARILRSQNREEKIWYELYHDMFSGSIEEWNLKQKEIIRNREIAKWLGSGTCVLVIGVLGAIGLVHYYSHHLRLSNLESSRVEVYRGRHQWPDPFNQKQFQYETHLSREEIESDKRFSVKNIESYTNINSELTVYLPLEERVTAYIHNGHYDKANQLFQQAALGSNAKQTREIIEKLSKLKNQESFKEIFRLASSNKDSELVKTAISLTEENISALPLTNLKDIRVFFHKIKSDIPGGIDHHSVAKSPLLINQLLNYQEKEDTSFFFTIFDMLREIASETGINENIVSFFKNSLDSKNPDVQLFSIEALGQNRISSATKALLEKALSTQTGRDLKIEIIAALGEIGTTESIDAIKKLLKKADKLESIKALKILKETDSFDSNEEENSALKMLITMLKSQNPGLRLEAAEAIGSFEHPEAQRALLKALKDNAQDIRSMAASVLGKANNHIAIAPLLNTLYDDNEDVRFNASSSLGNIGNTVAAPALLRLIERENRDYVLIGAIAALGKIGDPAATDKLVNTLGHDNSEIADQAIEALSDISDTATLRKLFTVLSDTKTIEIRRDALRVIKEIGGQNAIGHLKKAMQHENATIREIAAEALSEVEHDDHTMALLSEALQDRDANVRKSAANALGNIGNRTALTTLLTAINDDNPDVRLSVATALGGIKSDLATQELLRLLHDENTDVRYSALEAIRSLSNVATLEQILKASRIEGSSGQSYTPLKILSDIDFPAKIHYKNTKNSRKNQEPYFIEGIRSYKKKQLIKRTLVSAPSEQRDRRLISHLNDNTLSSEARLFILEVIENSKHHLEKTIIQLKKVTPTNLKFKHKLQNTLKLLMEEQTADLSSEKIAIRVNHINKLAKNSDKSQAKQAILNILHQDDNDNPLNSLAYRLLADLEMTTEIPLLQKRLKTLEQQYEKWRAFRDSKAGDDFEKTQDYAEFLAEVRAHKKRINPNAAFDYAYALSRLDPATGLEFLSHPITEVRQGSYTGFTMKANIKWLKKLDELREQRRNDPVFRYTTFRALDLGLWRLEVLGNKNNNDREYDQLIEWQQELESDQTRKTNHKNAKDPDDEVLERLQWTTMMMKHTKKMTAKFAKDGWVRDWPDNTLPVNQPYPEL